ncbi:MAG: family 10 glycosylhydrolase [Lachnospirales bacterium]
MRKQMVISIVLSIVLLFQIFTINTPAENVGEAENIEQEERMRGVWVSTVLNLDYPLNKTTNHYSLMKEADNIIAKCDELGFNAIFLQVRPTSDAFYKSNIFPWSKYLTGSQGTEPDGNFDPLKYWITECHKRGIELHAWINPYRVTRETGGASLSNLANTNPAKQHPEYVIKYSDGNYYYDPGIPAVRQLLIDGIMEIVNNYDVDGIHMDDYFYPGQDFDDYATYKNYGQGMTIDDWRRSNVDTLIEQIHNNLELLGKNVEFGISPSGVWANKDNNPLGSDTRGSESYYKLYADTRKWALEEWIDYICPQIYWEIGHKSADYKTLANWWADTLSNCNTKLYIGLADYKCDDVNSTSVWYNGKAIQEQLNLNKTLDKISGEVHFRYGLIVENEGLCNVIKNENNKSQIVETTTTTEAQTETTTYSIVETVTETTTILDVNSIINNDPVKVLVYINGKKIEFDQEPVIKNGRTLVPFRKIFEELGAEVTWYNDTGQVIAKLDDKEISLVIGENIMLLNKSESVKLDTPPEIINSRTMVPLRAISESLGMKVNWYNDNRVITINS